jgi:hypothetical protein
MGFWVATADSSGNRITNSEVLLQPGPTKVTYPGEAAGQYLDTTDGSVVQQQPARDGRRREWIWVGYPESQAGFRRVWPLLESLRSRFRAENGLSPYVYLKEDVPQGLRFRTVLTGTGSGSGFTFTDGSANWSALSLGGGSITAAGQSRAILANATTTLSIGDAFIGSPSGAYVLSYFTNPWYRARVLDVPRTTNDDGRTVRYEGKLIFVIDDPNSGQLIG